MCVIKGKISRSFIRRLNVATWSCSQGKERQTHLVTKPSHVYFKLNISPLTNWSQKETWLCWMNGRKENPLSIISSYFPYQRFFFLLKASVEMSRNHIFWIPHDNVLFDFHSSLAVTIFYLSSVNCAKANHWYNHWSKGLRVVGVISSYRSTELSQISRVKFTVNSLSSTMV